MLTHKRSLLKPGDVEACQFGCRLAHDEHAVCGQISVNDILLMDVLQRTEDVEQKRLEVLHGKPVPVETPCDKDVLKARPLVVFRDVEPRQSVCVDVVKR